MSGLEFVNINGHRVNVSVDRKASPKKMSSTNEEYHKGFRVVGVPPGALEAAEAESSEADSKKFDRDNWLMNAKDKPVRAKPYEIRSAAEMCAEMARRSGWLRVSIVEMKREKV